METIAKPYRVAKTTNGRPDGVVALTSTRYGVRADAENWVARIGSPGMYEPTYIIIEPGQVRAAVAQIKANTLTDFLRTHRAQVASDYDDARERLLKLATLADREFERSHKNGPRKGFLKTEAGLTGMFELMHIRSERQRVVSASLTPEEQARRYELERANRHMSVRDALAKEFDAEFKAKALELASASLHADEY